MKLVVLPYKFTSKSAQKIAKALETVYEGPDAIIDKIRSGEYSRDKTIIVNWGNGWTGSSGDIHTFNHPRNVMNSVSKITTFKLVNARTDVPIPWWTTNMSEAKQRIAASGLPIMCREADSHDGKGIVIANKESEIVPASLYTEKFVCDREFRVHVAFGNPFLIVERKPNPGFDVPDFPIRTGMNWTLHMPDYMPEHIKAGIKNIGINALYALDLDFGAMDIGYNSAENRLCLFETNTAPSDLGPRTLSGYVNHFTKAATGVI